MKQWNVDEQAWEVRRKRRMFDMSKAYPRAPKRPLNINWSALALWAVVLGLWAFIGVMLAWRG